MSQHFGKPLQQTIHIMNEEFFLVPEPVPDLLFKKILIFQLSLPARAAV